MDNDNKVDNVKADVTKNGVSLFLRDELVPLKKRKDVESYDLEREYAKTRLNRNYRIWIVLGICFLVSILVTYFSVSGLARADREIEVKLDAFEDLNLRNLLDTITKAQNQYDEASRNKIDIETAMNTKLNQAKNTRSADLDILNSSHLGPAATKRRNQQILDTYNNEVKAIHAEYDEQLAKAEAELKQYDEQLKSYDSQNVEKAQQFEKAMDSERQLRELEKKQLTEDYEQKLENARQELADTQKKDYEDKRKAIRTLSQSYDAQIAELDPVIKDAKADLILQDATLPAAGEAFDPTAYSAALSEADVFLAALEDVKLKYDNYVYLNSLLSAIPQKNTASTVVKTEKQLTYSMIASLADTAVNQMASMNTKIKDLESEKSTLQAAFNANAVVFDELALAQKVDGFILDMANPNGIYVYMTTTTKSSVTQDGKTKAAILNTKGKKIGTGVLYNKNGVYLFPDTEIAELKAGCAVRLEKK